MSFTSARAYHWTVLSLLLGPLVFVTAGCSGTDLDSFEAIDGSLTGETGGSLDGALPEGAAGSADAQETGPQGDGARVDSPTTTSDAPLCTGITCSGHGTCAPIGSTLTCVCNSGYTPQGIACIDIDECLTNNGGCDKLTTCTNTPGARTCSACPAGYTGTGVAGCTDVNECVTANGGCDPLTTCTNTVGSRTCSACPAGYTGTGATGCADTNECLTSNGGCDPLTTCTNTAGTRTCGPCPTGYTGTGLTGCKDVNECLTNNGGCDVHAKCTNTPGSHTCGPCPAGYTGTGATSCTDINECLTSNGGCDPLTTCTNTVGSRTCSACPAGYTGTGVTGCTDINECLTTNGGCDANALCTNTAGSRTCACKNGFDGDGLTCSNCCRARAGATGCSVSTVQTCVCMNDMYCCNTRWDAQCVKEVTTFGCGTCP